MPKKGEWKGNLPDGFGNYTFGSYGKYHGEFKKGM
jgi:hypothetical protein